MSATPSSFISEKKPLYLSEKERKTRLLRLFCLIFIILQGLAVCNTILSSLLTGIFQPTLPIFIFLFFLTTFSSYQLAGRGHYDFASWLLIISTTIIIVTFNIIYGITLPMLMIYLLPLTLATVFLNVPGIIILSFFVILTHVGLVVAQGILKVYTPSMVIKESNLISSNLFFAIFFIPALMAIIVIPARQQMKALQHQNDRLAEALQEVETRRKASQQVSQRVLQLSAELRATASQQAGGSQEQAANLSQIGTSIAELSATAAQIAELAQQITSSSELMTSSSRQIEQTVQLSANQSEQGKQSVEQTITVSQEVTTLYERLQNTLDDLSLKSDRTRHILALLKAISEETHLLALNASIEAAGAGAFGERFGVVAQEVKSLANRSSRASQEVVAIINEIEEATGEAVEAVQTGYRKAQEMKEVAREAGTVIEGMRLIAAQAHSEATAITQVARTVRELSEVITRATQQQRTASEQVVAGVSGVSIVAHQSAEGSVDISSTATNLEEMSNHLTASLAA